MSDEIVKHDTDALLLEYAPKSRDVDVCISTMKDHIDMWEKTANEYQVRMERMEDALDKLERERDEALKNLGEFLEIARHSNGVAGWHLNGDLAEWDEILEHNDL